MNCYEILEVSQNASPEVIKAAYKSLMQRYHPDKNPGNAGIAERALAVVQAYEVLSDPGKRATYDIKLKQQPAGNLNVIRDGGRAKRASAIAAKESKSYWILWLLIALTIMFSLFAMSLLKDKEASETELTGIRLSLEGSQLTQEQIQKQIREQSHQLEEILGTFQEASRGESGKKLDDVSARTIQEYISNLTVYLRAKEGYSKEDVRVLVIPKLGVIVGTSEAEKIADFLNNNKGLIRQKLEEKLVGAKYDELMKADGEQYLKGIVIDSIGETTGTNRYKNDLIYGKEASGNYGVVDVMLPQSFSVQ